MCLYICHYVLDHLIEHSRGTSSTAHHMMVDQSIVPPHELLAMVSYFDALQSQNISISIACLILVYQHYYSREQRTKLFVNGLYRLCGCSEGSKVATLASPSAADILVHGEETTFDGSTAKI